MPTNWVKLLLKGTQCTTQTGLPLGTVHKALPAKLSRHYDITADKLGVIRFPHSGGYESVACEQIELVPAMWVWE